MKNLILNNELTMSSVEIADLTGKRHDHVLEDVRKMFSELEINAPDFSGTQKYGNNNTREIFNLPKDLTLTLVAGYSIVLRKKIIDRWMELELGQFKLPTTFAEALRLAADRQEALDKAQAQIEQDKPKVVFAEAVRNMQGACSVGDFAKTLGTGRNRLFKKLKDDEILMADRMPYQQYIDRGLFVVIEQIPYTDSKGVTQPAFKTLITGKGQVWLENKYREIKVPLGKEAQSNKPSAFRLA